MRKTCKKNLAGATHHTRLTAPPKRPFKNYRYCPASTPSLDVNIYTYMSKSSIYIFIHIYISLTDLVYSKDSPLPVHIDVWYGMGLKPGGELEVLGEAVSRLPVVLVIEVGAAQVIGHQPQQQLLWTLRYTEGRS
jgi:hypothetical protein